VKWLTNISFLLLFSNFGNAQTTVNQIIKTNFSYMQNIRNSEYYGYDVSVGGGITINNQLSILLQANYLKNQRDDNSDNFDALQMLTTSISLSGRFLDKKHKFSPVLEFDIGVNIWSNANSHFVDNNYIIQETPNHITDYEFLNNSIIVKTKLLLNFNLKSFDFFIGPSLNAYGFHVKRYSAQTIYGYQTEKKFFDLQEGIGFEAQVQYTFPMKK
jgi:hypothetical protein